MTGWRVGWAVGPPNITKAIRKVHDYMTVAAPAPLQEAGAAALQLPRSYYLELATMYQSRRDQLIPALQQAGFRCFRPRGAYYVMTDISGFRFADDVSFIRHLITDVGVAAIPGSSFYLDPNDGAQQIRFAFCKRHETVVAAVERLRAAEKMKISG